MSRAAQFFAIFVAGFAFVELPAAEPPRVRPNVVFIVADDLRPDTLGFAGSNLIRTPNLDRLAARGAVFTRATCSYPICHVSRSEMFTGRVLLGAGKGGLKFDPAWMLWPEQMKRHGWHTVYSGKWHVSGTPASTGFATTAGLYSAGGAAGAPLTLPITPTGRVVTGYTGWTFKNENNQPLPELGIGLVPEPTESSPIAPSRCCSEGVTSCFFSRLISPLRTIRCIGRRAKARQAITIAFRCPQIFVPPIPSTPAISKVVMKASSPLRAQSRTCRRNGRSMCGRWKTSIAKSAGSCVRSRQLACWSRRSSSSRVITDWRSGVMA